jgi:hypothetical protein
MMDTLITKKKWLMNRLDQNYLDFRAAMLKLHKEDIFYKADEITACQTTYHHMRDIKQYVETELDYLLKFKNPLELVTDHYKQDIRVDLDAVIYRICDTQDLLNDYPFMPDNKQHETER